MEYNREADLKEKLLNDSYQIDVKEMDEEIAIYCTVLLLMI